MRFGFYLPTRGPLATRPQLKSFLATGEAVGFHSVMVADHIVVPAKIDSAYPYTVKGNFGGLLEFFEFFSDALADLLAAVG